MSPPNRIRKVENYTCFSTRCAVCEVRAELVRAAGPGAEVDCEYEHAGVRTSSGLASPATSRMVDTANGKIRSPRVPLPHAMYDGRNQEQLFDSLPLGTASAAR